MYTQWCTRGYIPEWARGIFICMGEARGHIENRSPKRRVYDDAVRNARERNSRYIYIIIIHGGSVGFSI